VPYTIVVVELEEGWYMLSNLVGVAPEKVRVGLPVQVFFERRSDEITLPLFRTAIDALEHSTATSGSQ